jgi:hypothetical protein
VSEIPASVRSAAPDLPGDKSKCQDPRFLVPAGVIVATFIVAELQRSVNKNVTPHFSTCHENLTGPDFT